MPLPQVPSGHPSTGLAASPRDLPRIGTGQTLCARGTRNAGNDTMGGAGLSITVRRKSTMTRQDLIWIAAWGMWALAGTLDAQGAEPSAGPKAIASPFFAMDTALRDGVNRTPQEQARLLKELGYAGLGGGPAGIEQSLAALDHEGLKLFTVYLGINLEQPDYTQIEKAAAALRGRDTIVWLTLTSTRYKPSSIEGDTQAVAILQKSSGCGPSQRTAHSAVSAYRVLDGTDPGCGTAGEEGRASEPRSDVQPLPLPARGG